MLRTSVFLALYLDVASACDARSLISKHEGKRLCVYKDTKGHPTIGIGYNLDNPGAPQAIAAVGANYDDVRSGKQCLTDSQVMKLFEPSYNSAVSGAQRAVSSFSSLCCNVQEVMIDMDYNLGDGGFASFTGFIGLINQKQWSAAAADGQRTAWCGQVGGRCSDDMGRVRQGCGGPSPSPPGPSPPSGSCKSCVSGGGGMACVSKCGSCGSACTSCIKGGGGMACAARCCDSVGLSNATASKQTVQQVETLATTFAKPAGTAERLASLERESPWSFRVAKTLDTCTGPHESCCEAPGDDPNNCPASARTSDCDKKKACCCG